ncbi:DinB family protein [Halalkalibacter oceani]|uniref:DinB family protein n=1 Tax=Halalkalibacter oceani TaxID=1653776 RepID=A0A9X2DPQ2_9BACI|nr:DinB family protein [Halalkalibacter oceani]MCM3714804.1 DinB family protein [Halalkalibacter oceani]
MALVPFSYARKAILQVVTSIDEDKLDFVPAGFANSIRWNVGHLLVIADRNLRHAANYQPVVPDHYTSFFDMGTAPAQWTDEPPSTADLIKYAEAQLEAVERISANGCDLPLAKTFNLRGTTFTTLSDLLGFLSYHEGLHLGACKLIKKNAGA